MGQHRQEESPTISCKGVIRFLLLADEHGLDCVHHCPLVVRRRSTMSPTIGVIIFLWQVVTPVHPVFTKKL